MQRRQFIKQLLGSSVLLIGGVTAYQTWWQWQGKAQLKLVALPHLDENRQLLVAALVPVFCQGMPQIPSLAVICDNIDQSISRLPRTTQRELDQLFDLLTSVWGRLLLAQQWAPWSQAEAESLDQRLTNWRDHALQLLQTAYLGLHQLIMGAIYAEPESWSGLGYPGPPSIPVAYPIEVAEIEVAEIEGAGDSE